MFVSYFCRNCFYNCILFRKSWPRNLAIHLPTFLASLPVRPVDENASPPCLSTVNLRWFLANLYQYALANFPHRFVMRAIARHGIARWFLLIARRERRSLVTESLEDHSLIASSCAQSLGMESLETLSYRLVVNADRSSRNHSIFLSHLHSPLLGDWRNELKY